MLIEVYSDLTGVVTEKSKRDVVIWLTDEDDNEPKKTRFCLWLTGGDRPFIEVKANMTVISSC